MGKKEDNNNRCKNIPTIKLNISERNDIIQTLIEDYVLNSIEINELVEVFEEKIGELREKIIECISHIDLSGLKKEQLQIIPIKRKNIDTIKLEIYKSFKNMFMIPLNIKSIVTKKIQDTLSKNHKKVYFSDEYNVYLLTLTIPELKKFLLPKKSNIMYHVEIIENKKVPAKLKIQLEKILENMNEILEQISENIKSFECLITPIIKRSNSLRSICKKIDGAEKILKKHIEDVREREKYVKDNKKDNNKNTKIKEEFKQLEKLVNDCNLTMEDYEKICKNLKEFKPTDMKTFIEKFNIECEDYRKITENLETIYKLIVKIVKSKTFKQIIDMTGIKTAPVKTITIPVSGINIFKDKKLRELDICISLYGKKVLKNIDHIYIYNYITESGKNQFNIELVNL